MTGDRDEPRDELADVQAEIDALITERTAGWPRWKVQALRNRLRAELERRRAERGGPGG